MAREVGMPRTIKAATPEVVLEVQEALLEAREQVKSGTASPEIQAAVVALEGVELIVVGAARA
jgi:hypothetical protein